METELLLLWIVVGLYIVGALAAFVGLVWRSEKALRIATPVAAIGLAVHTVPLLLRWVRIGHGPYINAYEVLSASVWVGVAFLVVLIVRLPWLRVAAGPVLGLSVILLGWGVMSSPEVQPLPPTFKGVWLVVHILFAKLAYGSIVVATGVAVAYLVRSRRARAAPGDDSIPASPSSLDDLAYRLVAFGFISLTFMIAAGSIWAHDAWGRFWSWDPLETWSLATWVAYGLFLHARLAYRVKGRISAYAILALMVVSVLAFFVSALVLPTVHTEFMVR